jgi:hypothetical protein
VKTAILRRLGLTLLLAGALCVPARGASAQPPAPPIPPGIGVKLLQVPVSLAKDPRAQDYIIDHLAPGSTITRQIAFSNGYDHSVDLSFYADAASIAGGQFVADNGRTANELSRWTSFSPTSAVIAADQIMAVTLTIAVPADASPGERYAAALGAETTPPAQAGGITSVSRIGIRIYLSVGPGGAPRTAFRIESMTAGRNGRNHPTVTVKVENTGGRAVDLSGRLELTDRASLLSAGPFSARTVETLAPGQGGDISFVLNRSLTNGPWQARVTLVSGLTSDSTTSRIMFPTDRAANANGSSTAVKSAGRAGSDLPVIVGAIGAGAVLVLCLLWFVRRRRKDKERLHPLEAQLASQ